MYLKQLAVVVELEKINTQNILTGEEFKEFFNVYKLKLGNEPQILNMVIWILKNISSTSECLVLVSARTFSLVSFIEILNIYIYFFSSECSNVFDEFAYFGYKFM